MLIAVAVTVAALIGASWVGRSRDHSRNRGTGFVIDYKVLAALRWDLSGRDGVQQAFGDVVNHAEDEGMALAICITSILACLGSLDGGRLFERGLGTTCAGCRAASIAGKERRARDGVDGGEGGKDGGEGLHFDGCVDGW